MAAPFLQLISNGSCQTTKHLLRIWTPLSLAGCSSAEPTSFSRCKPKILLLLWYGKCLEKTFAKRSEAAYSGFSNFRELDSRK